MPIQLDKKANEGSTYPLTVRFFDENGGPVVPVTATWTLLGDDGAVVNARSAVAISPLAAVATIVLHGADLDVDAGGTFRDLLIQATYNSTLGNGLESNEAFHFGIEPLPGM